MVNIGVSQFDFEQEESEEKTWGWLREIRETVSSRFLARNQTYLQIEGFNTANK